MGCVLAVAWTLFLLFLAHVAMTQADVRQPRTRLSVLSSPASSLFRLACSHVSGKDWLVLGHLPNPAISSGPSFVRFAARLFICVRVSIVSNFYDLILASLSEMGIPPSFFYSASVTLFFKASVAVPRLASRVGGEGTQWAGTPLAGAIVSK